MGRKKMKRLCLPFFALLCVLVSIDRVEAQQRTVGRVQPNPAILAHARALLAARNPEEAIELLSRHLKSHPQDSSARLLLAEAYTLAGQADRAEEQYQTLLQFAPDNYLALAGLGEIYERAGNLEKAEPILAHATQLSRGQPKVQMEWATVLARLHRYSEASRAIAGISPPNSPEERLSFYRLKASLSAGLGDANRAAAEMEKGLAISPNQTGLQMATAAAEIQAKHWKRASALAGPLFNRIHDPAVGLMLIEAQLEATDDIHPMLDALRNVSLPVQQELPLRQRLAELLIAHGRFAESVDELRRALDLDPGRADLSFNLALAEFKAGRLDDALKTGEGLRKDADDAELEDLLGDIQEARGDNLSAVRSYQAAVALAPNEEKYRLSLALDFIRHKSFEPARAVLKQAEELHSDSWRIEVALGMVEYFAGSADDAARRLLKAAELAPDPELALTYLGEVQMDEAGAPNPAALTRLCEYGDANSKAGRLQLYCAALLFRRDYASHDRTHADEIFRRLNAVSKALPRDAAPHCQLGKAYRWIEDWQKALRESEVCAHMDPNSADAHYRLAQIYQHLGQQRQSGQEMKLYQSASARVADENAKRDDTIKTFLYSIQDGSRAPR